MLKTPPWLPSSLGFKDKISVWYYWTLLPLWPFSHSSSLALAPAPVPFLDTPGSLLRTFILVVTLLGNPSPQCPTSPSPCLQICSNLTSRGFHRPSCIKTCTHTPPLYPLVLFNVIPFTTTWHHMYLLVIFYSPSSLPYTRAELCLVYCWTSAAGILPAISWGLRYLWDKWMNDSPAQKYIC